MSLVLLAVIAISSAARADTIITRDHLSYTNVTIQGFPGNEVAYLRSDDQPGNVELAKVESIRVANPFIAAGPVINAAEELRDKHDDAGALKAFAALRAGAGAAPGAPAIKEPWLRQWIDARIVQLGDKQKDDPAAAQAAVEAYARLAESNAPSYLLFLPPKDSLPNLAPDQAKSLIDRLDTAKRAVKDDVSLKPINSLRAALVKIAAGAGGTTSRPAASADGNSNAAAAQDAMLVLPQLLRRDAADPVAKLLAARQYDQALAAVDAALPATTDPARLARLFYEQGLARLGAAASSDDPDAAMKDAGLSFMRSIVYGPGGTSGVSASTLETASRIELALIHLKLGNRPVARKQCDRAATLMKGIDRRAEPELAKRLSELDAATR